MGENHQKEKDTGHLPLIQKLIESVEYGNVTIVIQDGRVVQIEKNEKYRLKS